MQIKELKISNYKSVEEVTLTNVNPFSAFVGPNASGKSNIFESIEFLNQCHRNDDPLEARRLFGKPEDLLYKKDIYRNIKITFQLNNDLEPWIAIDNGNGFESDHLLKSKPGNYLDGKNPFETPTLKQFYNFTRLFIGNQNIKRSNYVDASKLNSDASNLESVLKRLLKNDALREEMLEELQLLIPGFTNLDVRHDEISGLDTLLVYEKGSDRPYTKNLISDGTFNIIALLTCIYQSETPQFICIEEPENGLNPFIAKEFVRIFRNACKERKHFIWINTHSQSMLSALDKKEVIIVDKIDGSTKAKQIKNIDTQGLKLDEALFTSILGGGTPW